MASCFSFLYRIPLLLDLGRLCLEQDRPELAGDCMEALKGNVKVFVSHSFMRSLHCQLKLKLYIYRKLKLYFSFLFTAIDSR